MKSLVIGASGQVGSLLVDECKKNEHQVLGTFSSYLERNDENHQLLNLGNLKNVTEVINDFHPDLIFLPAAITLVDLCEESPSETRKINVNGVKMVVDLMPPEATLVFYSTDFVFDGTEGLYLETDLPNPINEYGKQKLIAENYIFHHCKKFRIIRTNLVYGPDAQGKNFVCRLINNLKNSVKVTIPKDEWVTPTYGPELAAFSVKLAQAELPSSVYHATGPEACSRLRFALEAARTFGCDASLIEPVTSADLVRSAPRPLNGGLRTRYQNLEFGMKVGFKQGLEHMFSCQEVT